MIVLYGIKNCDTCKKARVWLEEHQIDYRFHDFRVDGLDGELLQDFIAEIGWEKLLNKSSTSWRQLLPEQQADLTEPKAKHLMLSVPTLIKRPLLVAEKGMILGFKPEFYDGILS